MKIWLSIARSFRQLRRRFGNPYRALWAVLLFLASASAVPAQTPPGRQFLHRNLPSVVTRLTPLRRFAGTNRLNLAIGLPLRNTNALAALLRQLQDPASPYYHHYLTPAQFTAMFGPSEQDYQAVIAFAGAHGLTVTATHPNRMLVDVNASVTDIERALHVTMRVYQHPTENRTFYAPATEPSLNLSVPVLRISGLNNYYTRRPMLKRPPAAPKSKVTPNYAGTAPDQNYWGSDFRKAYAPGVNLTGSGQTVGLLEFDGYYPGDIATYEAQAGLPSVPLQNVYVDASYVPPGPGNGEVALDIEVAVSMAPGLSKIVVYQAPNPSPWEDLLNRMVQDSQVQQFSCSWGGGENPNPVADQIFQQMAAQGQSFFDAVGDSDAFVGAIPFPSDNPYITEVGGTTLTTDPLGAWQSETVWNWDVEYGPIADGIGSSGGISTVYPIPYWQTNVDMSVNGGSTTMRNTPDVALTADQIYIVADNGTPEPGTGGTSAAAPLWAAFTALINQQASLNGRPSVGFLNPAIYSIGTGSNSFASYTSTFHDILTGSNTWSGSPDQFIAVPGYDLCTGWGTPAGQGLIDALAGSAPRTGILQTSVTPPDGSVLLTSSSQPIAVTVADGSPITNATVTAAIPGVTNLVFQQSTNNAGAYTATLQVPATTGPLTMTVIATATNEISATNVVSYTVVSPPPNDNFANAIQVPAQGATYLENNTYATLETGEPVHDGDTNAAASLWWNYASASGTNVFIDTTGSAVPTILAVYTGRTLTGLALVAATNGAGLSQQAYLSVDVSPGITYHIALASVSSNQVGSVRFAVVPGGAPDTAPPDVLVSSPLSGLWVTNKQVVVTGTAADFGSGASGVKQVTVNVNRFWNFTASGTTNWSAFAALLPGLNNIKVTAQDVAGNVSTPVSLQLTYLPPPGAPNDLFANALPLVFTNGAGVVSADTTNATKEFGEPNHAGNVGGHSVWWYFTPTNDGVLTLSTTNSTFPTLLALYTGSKVSQLTDIASDVTAYQGAPGGFSFLQQAVRANQTYHIAVDGADGAFGTAILSYSFTPATVYSLTANSTVGGTVSATTANPFGGTQVMPGSSGNFADGSVVTLTASPFQYFVFNNWTGVVASAANPLALTITNNVNLTGTFSPTPYTDGFESGTLTHLPWTSGGDAPWFIESTNVASGQYAARSGVIGDNQTSSLILTTNFAAGFASFDYRVSSETNFDLLHFYVDGVQLRKWSGEVGWSTYAFPLTAGQHTLEWTYSKDPSLSAGMDAAFIDDLNLPLSVPVSNLSPVRLQMVNLGDGTFAVNLFGQTNQQYILQSSTNLVNWQNIATNVATGGSIQFPAVTPSNSASFYRALVAPQ